MHQRIGPRSKEAGIDNSGRHSISYSDQHDVVRVKTCLGLSNRPSSKTYGHISLSVP